MHKEPLAFRIAMICILLSAITVTLCAIFTAAKSSKSKTIDLPEEISQAKTGDLLEVERVTRDSIYIGFKH